MLEILLAIYSRYRRVRLLTCFGLASIGYILFETTGGFPPFAWRFLFTVLPRLQNLWVTQGPTLLLPMVGLLFYSLALLILWSIVIMGISYSLVLLWNNPVSLNVPNSNMQWSQWPERQEASISQSDYSGQTNRQTTAYPYSPQTRHLQYETLKERATINTQNESYTDAKTTNSRIDLSQGIITTATPQATLADKQNKSVKTQNVGMTTSPNKRNQTGMERTITTTAKARAITIPPLSNRKISLFDDVYPDTSTPTTDTNKDQNISTRNAKAITIPPLSNRKISLFDDVYPDASIPTTDTNEDQAISTRNASAATIPPVPDPDKDISIFDSIYPNASARTTGTEIDADQNTATRNTRLPMTEEEKNTPPYVTWDDDEEQEAPVRLIISIGIDPGLVRKDQPNEDSIFAIQGIRENATGPVPAGLFVIADGMGGHSNGRDASRLAVRSISDIIVPTLLRENDSKGAELNSNEQEFLLDLLKDGVHRANLAIYSRNRETREMMGTTLTAALVVDTTAYIVNVGDSRTYLYRAEDGLVQITRDHSLVARLVEQGAIRKEEVYTHPQRNQIYRCLGDRSTVDMDTFVVSLQPDDILLLCSDGLWEMVHDAAMEKIIATTAHQPTQMSNILVQAALNQGGADNISVITVNVVKTTLS